MISLLILNNFYPMISYRRVSKEKESDRLLHTVSVARYGPRTSCQRKRLRYVLRPDILHFAISLRLFHLSKLFPLHIPRAKKKEDGR